VYFWKNVKPLLVRLQKAGFSVNSAVNEALIFWLGAKGDDQLRLRARLVELRHEEAELRQTMRVMLRSGSYLPQYADKLFREGYVKGESPFVRMGQVPLKALSPKEEAIARRVLAERERIAQEITEILDQLLPDKKFHLKPESRSRDNKKTSMGVKMQNE